MRTVRPFRPGTVIEAIAPSSAFDPETFRRGVALVEARGGRARFTDGIFAKERFLAGPDARRLAELQAALVAPGSDLLWCGRGGYGLSRLLPDLDVEAISRAGKPIIGFSDVTALHALWWKAGVPSVHGPMLARLPTEPPDVQERLFSLLETGRTPPLQGATVVSGQARGRLGGGNLMVLSSLCGTPFQPNFSGAILFLEDIGERPYRLDRLFVQGTQAGLFRGIAGLAFGEFTDCEEKDGSATSAGVLREWAEKLGVPCIEGLPAGHGVVNRAMPFGVPATLDADRGTLTFDPIAMDEAVS